LTVVADSIDQEQEVRRLRKREWLEQNETAIQAYNRDVEHQGAFSDGLRTFDVQSDLLESLATRVVVPLAASSAARAIRSRA
jgi:hypothetical protein